RWGVRQEQLTVSYAMAENVFGVTQSTPGELRVLDADRAAFAERHVIEPGAPADSVRLVSNGTVLPGTELVVLDEAGRPLAGNQVGELAFRGRYLFDGYFGREDLTRAAMTAEGWYRTGDLGALVDGHVYVTGRKKDLIIIQGRNFYPTDIERCTAAVEG